MYEARPGAECWSVYTMKGGELVGLVYRKVCGENLFEQVLNIIHPLILPTGALFWIFEVRFWISEVGVLEWQ